MNQVVKLWETFNNYIELSQRIDKFIEEYAGIRPDYDPDYDDDDEKYTSPDASEMLKCSMMLKNNMKPDYCFSQWSSGGYVPYTSVVGELEHDAIKTEIKNLK